MQWTFLWTARPLSNKIDGSSPLYSQPLFAAHLSEENGDRSNEVLLYNKQRKLQQLRPFKWDSTVQQNNEKYNSDCSNEILLYYKTAKTTATVTVQIRFHCTAKLCTTTRSTNTNLVAKINHNLQTFFYFSLKVDFFASQDKYYCCCSDEKGSVRRHGGCTQPHNM